MNNTQQLFLFGIKNCDTVRKARRWLETNDINYQFHDFRVDGLDKSIINTWLELVSWQELLNKRSTTWRQISMEQKEALDQSRAIDLIVTNPTLIKRPVLLSDNHVIIGFDESKYGQLRK